MTSLIEWAKWAACCLLAEFQWLLPQSWKVRVCNYAFKKSASYGLANEAVLEGVQGVLKAYENMTPKMSLDDVNNCLKTVDAVVDEVVTQCPQFACCRTMMVYRIRSELHDARERLLR